MAEFDFLDEIPIDRVHTLDQLTGRFQSVRDGLAELVKNSKDHYGRLGINDPAHRQIVVLVDSKKRSLAVLDFAGATRADFDGWITWSSRTASQSHRSPDIEGGHGNGGKAFMVRGSSGKSFMESVSAGKRTKMGFKNDEADKLYKPAWALEGGSRVCETIEIDTNLRLSKALREFGLRIDSLPPDVQVAYNARRAFTLVYVGDIRDWRERRPSTVRDLAARVAVDLMAHAQAALTIESCKVWVIVDGEAGQVEPLNVQYPSEMPGFPEQIVPIPATLSDPDTGDTIATGSADGTLVLRTTAEQLRMSERTKALNVLRIRNDRNIVANWSVGDLVPRAESAFIYGTLSLASLGSEHQAGSDRRDLADTPLVRALRTWATAHIEDLGERIQQARSASHRPEDRQRASTFLDKLRELMQQYLDASSALPGSGDGSGEGGAGSTGTEEKKKGKVVQEVLLEAGLASISLAVGTKVPLRVRCFEIQADGARLPVSFSTVQISEGDSAIVGVSEDLLLHGVAPGKTQMAVSCDGVQSNTIEINVVTCTDVELILPTEPVLRGGVGDLGAVFTTPDGSRQDLWLEASVDEPSFLRVSRTGRLFGGQHSGTATVRVRFGPGALDQRSGIVQVGPESAPPAKAGKEGGQNIPLILLCGQPAPGKEDLPPDQRTLKGGEFYPTIVEEPQFKHIIWINPDSREARRVRQTRGGSGGVGKISSTSFGQFLALKCFDVLKGLRVRADIRDQAVTSVEYTNLLASAELACAGFLDSAYELAESMRAVAQEMSGSPQ